uniref:U2A'/phosphoprotein 32 family A C-terminal domain-containing protein n=1 Tax=Spongospora subterranea TaxID=70186 RepID=A0A0H5QXA7_9EUKA|eukprot:CRZ06251.1 hypothetical protein [Spongospora subterranea]
MPIETLSAKFIADLATNYNHLERVDLSHNCIKVIENLSPLTYLKSLDLSNNFISVLGNTGALLCLSELNVAHNLISTVDMSVQDAVNLSYVDARHNRLESLDNLAALSGLHQLQSLHLEGNPICSIRNYRQHVTRLLPQLQVLDGRPILVVERMPSTSLSPERPNITSRPNLSTSNPRAARFSTSPKREVIHHAPQSCEQYSADDREERQEDGNVLENINQDMVHPVNYDGNYSGIRFPTCEGSSLNHVRMKKIDAQRNSLKRQLELRDIQIASFEKLLKMQNLWSLQESEIDILQCWRKKVYELLVRLESQRINIEYSEQEFILTANTNKQQIASLRSQVDILGLTANRHAAENEILVSRKQLAEQNLAVEQNVCKALSNRILRRQERDIFLKSLICEVSQIFHPSRLGISASLDELDGFSQRIQFALSRISIVIGVFRKKAELRKVYNQLPHCRASTNSSLRIAGPRLHCMELEIHRLTQERSMLLQRISEFDRREQESVESTNAGITAQLLNAVAERDSAINTQRDLLEEKALLLKKNNQQTNIIETLKTEIDSMKQTCQSEQTHLINAHGESLTALYDDFKAAVESMSAIYLEKVNECKQLTELQLAGEAKLTILEDQLRKYEQNICSRPTLRCHTGALQMVVDKCLRNQAMQREKYLHYVELSEKIILAQSSKQIRHADAQTDTVECMAIEANGVSVPTSTRLERLASLATSLL